MTASVIDDLSSEIEVEDAEWRRIERAAEEAGFDTVAAFIEEATQRMVADVLDEDGDLECPHEDCSETFATVRQRNGHLGASHAQDVPEGDFWCGYCGHGPTSWRGVNAHHGHDHDGPPIHLQEEPNREDLIAPDDLPDHKDELLLRELYRKHEGNYTEMCRAHDFDVGPGRVRHYLIEFGIHEPTPQGPHQSGDGPLYRDPDWLEERYEAADGNISELHRRLEADDEAPDVPYRTLVKSLKTLGIHDPTDPPGKRHGKGGPSGDARDQESPSDHTDDTEPTDSASAPDIDEEAIDTEEPDEESSPSPPIEWDFGDGFQTVTEQQTDTHDRLVEDLNCSRCGEPYEGDGVCDSCADGHEDDLVTDGGVIVSTGVRERGWWYDVEWMQCHRCWGTGEHVECYDDLCHAQGRCMHDPAKNVCNLCGGTGRVTKELDERWFSRDAFESVTAPDADLLNQGKLHAVARERREGGESA